MSAPIRVLLVGAKGRMGRAIADAAAKDPSLTIATGLARGDVIAPALENCDVVIDFSAAELTTEVCAACAKRGKPLVLGTTGQSTAQKDTVAVAAHSIAIVFAANFSTGVNTLFALTRRAAKLLGNGFDLDVVEMHHRTKKDAPSGTAKRLLEILQQARGREVAAQSIRAGDIVGEHTVIFTGPGERLELTHRAASRETFALGALRAARWALTQPPGLYQMEDVLGLEI
ncbi:MAG TPA: dihydrodipicolinate reductase C-terminal domain-containing protein [Chthoniobacterales bacterium]